jgi:PilZ domain
MEPAPCSSRGGIPSSDPKDGRIVFNHRRSVLDCTVRNLSSTGACLDVQSTVGVPDVFELIIEPDGISRPCRIAWRSERRTGVHFSE